jgi:hypothetical protein
MSLSLSSSIQVAQRPSCRQVCVRVSAHMRPWTIVGGGRIGQVGLVLYGIGFENKKITNHHPQALKSMGSGGDVGAVQCIA